MTQDNLQTITELPNTLPYLNHAAPGDLILLTFL